jgi:hypothetical protein
MEIEIKGDVNLINRSLVDIDYLIGNIDNPEFILDLRNNYNHELLSADLLKWFRKLDKTSFDYIEFYKIENAGIYVTKLRAITKLNIKIKIRFGYGTIRINVKGNKK